MSKKDIHVSLPGREEIQLSIELEGDLIVDAKLTGIGGSELLECLVDYRKKLTGSVKDLPLPEGQSAASMLLREVILKAKDQWQMPFTEEELCHCRGIPTKNVDMAIVTGAKTPEKVSELTSASTACGTCRPDVEAIIRYRNNF